jgi:hypothetical membrane protein
MRKSSDQEVVMPGVVARSAGAQRNPRLTAANRRLFGAGAVFGLAVALVAWTVASAIEPGYSVVNDDLSALAALGAAHPWITMTGELLLGIGIVALAAGLVGRFPGRRAAIACWILLATGLTTVIQAVAREDCSTKVEGCRARIQAGDLSWHHWLHEATSALAFIGILLVPPLLARPFRNDPHWRDLARYSVATAVVGVVLLAVFLPTSDGAGGGLTERVFLVVPLAWVAVVGVRLARAPGRAAP